MTELNNIFVIRFIDGESCPKVLTIVEAMKIKGFKYFPKLEEWEFNGKRLKIGRKYYDFGRTGMNLQEIMGVYDFSQKEQVQSVLCLASRIDVEFNPDLAD